MLFTSILSFLYLVFEGLYNAVGPVISFMTFEIPWLTDGLGNNLTVGSVLFGAGIVVYLSWTIVNWILPT